MLGCASFEDSIGVNGWPMESHVAGDVIFKFPPIPESRGFNELPYRMLVPEGIDNLLMAGRCASMTHDGQSAARVSGACFAMGEAAGAAAALALSGNTIPRDIAVEKLQQALKQQGAFIGRDQSGARRAVENEYGGNGMTGFARLALAGLLAMAAGGIARADDALKAKIGVLRLSSSAPVFIAQDKGYFREAGLDIELKFFDAAQPIAVATTSGDVDFGITAFTAGLYNLAGKGTLKVIGGMSREKAGYPLIGYFASNNAYAAGLKTPKDLAGKRIAVTQVGSSFHYSLGLLADKYGFKLARREGAAAAVAVECRGRAEGRNRRCRVAAGLDRAHADGFRRRKIPGLGRRRDAVAARRGVRLAEDADQQGAGDEAARPRWRAPTANITT